MNRRRIRRYQRGRGNSGMHFFTFIGIMIVAIVLGYLTARFVIAPIIGYDTDVLNLNILDKDNNSNEDKDKDTDQSLSDTGYALQFGVFSSKSRAEELVDDLKDKGIDADILKRDDKYKVISEILKTKEKAIDSLKEIQNYKLDDVFVTVIDKGKE
ncbi:MAG: SPOR domain-containing protein [Eubacteriales bacterium]|nr:SPOR domain-containing protein [Eubacteriales bacterium]